MATISQSTTGSEVARRLVKMAIAVVGLIVIRLILDNLPMLKDAHPILVGGSDAMGADWARVAQEIVQTGRLPTNVEGFAVAPIILAVSIANAIVDTLIFAVLVGGAIGFNGLIRERSKRLPEGGLIVLLLALAVIGALAYRSYSGVILPLLGTHANMYGWFFLALGLLPLIGLIVVSSRNLDTITEVIFSSTGRAMAASVQKTGASACPKCGNALAASVKFCGACGTPVPAPSAIAHILCKECGTKSEDGAKFCKSCGKPLVAA